MPKMRAVQVAHAGGPFEIVEREIPEPESGMVRIKVQACGVCHSDQVTKEGLFPGIQYPRVPGHEVIGLIDAVGANVPPDGRLASEWASVGTAATAAIATVAAGETFLPARPAPRSPGSPGTAAMPNIWLRLSRPLPWCRKSCRPRRQLLSCVPASPPSIACATAARGRATSSP